jgi:hypothetical protein
MSPARHISRNRRVSQSGIAKLLTTPDSIILAMVRASL